MLRYIVKTTDGYLYPIEDGDVSWTDDIAEAGHFNGVEEAHGTAEALGYHECSYEVLTVQPVNTKN